EHKVGQRLADLIALPGGLLAVDEGKAELILLHSREGADLEVAQRLAGPHSPVSVRLARDGTRCTAASLWARQLTIVALDPLRCSQTPDLPFAPRSQIWINDKKVAVADSFGGKLAIVDTERCLVQAVHTLPAHNIRGMALSADKESLLIAHQTLNPLGRSS